ncbi:MAG: PEP-utilizing enzyme, partial [Cognatishimia sp.]|nr:PEP-utilizing enzyme [Cognatishimia sp.]
MSPDTHGGRAKCLQRLVRMEMPVPTTVALSFEAVHNIAAGDMPDLARLISPFEDGQILCVRPSSQDPDWGGPGAVLNIGMNAERHAHLSNTLGREAADELYFRFIQAYSVHVARLDPDMFDDIDPTDANAVNAALDAYEDEADEAFPQDPKEQLGGVLRSMARAWEGTSARLLRMAKGAPADAGLGLVVQAMVLGLGQGECGSGVLQLVDSVSGTPMIKGRYLSQSQGRDALEAGEKSLFLEKDERGPSLEDQAPEAFAELIKHAEAMRVRLREEMQVEFTLENGGVHILDGVRVQRSARASVRVAVALAEDGVISRQEALLRVEPRALNELLHRQVDPDADRDVVGSGVAASPGAATGKIVFSAADAQASAARGEAAVLVRRETNPEDIRGMHAAVAVLTERGGITSHAAVIGRGMGLPCVVGASEIRFQARRKQLIAPDGRVFGEGDILTIDGSNGQVLAGQPPMLEAALDESFQKLMSWADENRDIDVRANADTPADALTARNFQAQGIGLCRTEHMFFEEDRLTA